MSPPSSSAPSSPLRLRGPVILFASFIALIFPCLLHASTPTLVALGAMTVGLAIATLDIVFTIQIHWNRYQTQLERLLNNIVLDDVLRSIFSLEEGWIGMCISSFAGTMWMYTLPLKEEQRVRLVQACLAPDINVDDARAILTQPGGLLKLLPESIRSKVCLLKQEDEQKTQDARDEMLSRPEDGSPSRRISTEELSLAGLVVARHDGNMNSTTHATMTRDMSWIEDDNDDGFTEDSTRSDGVDSRGADNSASRDLEAMTDYEDTSRVSVHNAASPFGTVENAVSDTSAGTNVVERTDECLLIRQQATHRPRGVQPLSTPTHPPPSPEEVTLSIMKELASDFLCNLFSAMDERSIRAIGASAAVSLLVQLRWSQTARRVLFGAVQGTAALGLASIAVGAAATWSVKRKVLEGQHSSGTAPSSNSEGCLRGNATGGVGDMSSTNGGRSSQQNTATAILRRLLSAIGQITKDEQFRRWRGVLAVMILLCFGRLRRKMISFH